MTFQPIVPFTGYSGWRFLQRTVESQRETFIARPDISRQIDYFRENIQNVESAADLVADRRLLTVALGAFGLSADLDSRYFIQKVLEEGTVESDSLANRLSDQRYRNLSETFGFGNINPDAGPKRSTLAEEIVSRFEKNTFIEEVGKSNEDMRLAMNFQSGLGEVTRKSSTEDARWFNIMGNPPLRRVMETALGLPPAISNINIDQQLDTFKTATRKILGSSDPKDILNEENMEKIIRLFLVRSEASAFSQNSPSAIALRLLS